MPVDRCPPSGHNKTASISPSVLQPWLESVPHYLSVPSPNTPSRAYSPSSLDILLSASLKRLVPYVGRGQASRVKRGGE